MAEGKFLSCNLSGKAQTNVAIAMDIMACGSMTTSSTACRRHVPHLATSRLVTMVLSSKCWAWSCGTSDRETSPSLHLASTATKCLAFFAFEPWRLKELPNIPWQCSVAKITKVDISFLTFDALTCIQVLPSSPDCGETTRSPFYAVCHRCLFPAPSKDCQIWPLSRVVAQQISRALSGKDREIAQHYHH